MAEEAYLGREDVMKLLKVDQAKLDDLIKQGKLKPAMEGELAKFKVDDIVSYMTEESTEIKEEKVPEVSEEKVEKEPEAVIEEPPLVTPEAEKPSEEGKVLPLGEEKPIRIEPKEVKPSPPPLEKMVEMPRIVEEEKRPEETIEIIKPEEVPTEVGKKEEVKEGAPIAPARPARAEVALPMEKEKKASPLFSLLFIFSLLLMLVAVGILLLPILKVPIPEFLKPAL